MKDFLKFTFATITGIIVSVVVLVFISILVVFSMVSSSESETQVRKNSIMMLDLNGALAERSPTQGRRTKSVIFTENNKIILSALQPETLAGRFNGNASEGD